MQNSNPQNPNRLVETLAHLPLTWVCVGFLAGIWLANLIGLAWYWWWIAACTAFTSALVIRLFRSHGTFQTPVWLFLGILSVLGLFLGAFRYQVGAARADSHPVSIYNDRPSDLFITGMISAPPDVRDTYTNLRVQVRSVDSGTGDTPASGLVLAYVDNQESWKYGEIVRLRGRLVTPPVFDTFSYRDYLARQGIFSLMPEADVTRLPFAPGGNPVLRVVYRFKDFALDRIYRIFPDPEASLLAGILLGNDNGLPETVQQAFRDTGTAHIIAISGFNISIIAGFFILVFSRLLGRKRGEILAIVGVAIYVLLVGPTASVLRAAIMGTLGILGHQIGRRQVGLNALSLSGAVLVLLDRNILWDVGFQLSFFATLGIILYTEPLQDWSLRLLSRFTLPKTAETIVHALSDLILVTLAAQVTVLPIMAWHFRSISLVSFIANPFILPVQPPLMVLSGFALLLSFIYIPLGQIFAWLAWPFAAYTIRAVEAFSRLPHGMIVLGDFSVLFVLVYFTILFLFTFSWGVLRKTLTAALKPAIIVVLLGSVIFLTWSAAFAAPDGNLHITFLDVGSADAILIQTPEGRNILVNGGSSTSVLASALGRRISPFDRRLDWVIVASIRTNQISALPRTLERIPPDQILWAGNVNGSQASKDLDRWLAERSIPVTRASIGMTLDLGSGGTLQVQNVTSRGAILLIQWNGFRMLLPIGQNFDSLTASAEGANIGPVTVLLLSDSGMAQSNPPEWITNLHPQVVILSVAAGNSTGLPDAGVIDSIQGTTLLRTDRSGWIEITTDGKSMWVDVQKK